MARAFRETEFASVTILIVRGVMLRPFSNLTRSANAVRRNLILLSKAVYNEPDYYAENNRIGDCAWFNSDGRVRPAFDNRSH